MRARAAGSPHSTACPPGPGKPRSPPACPPPTWVPAGAFPWGPQCALLRRSPHSISGEESEIIAQVSTRLQLQAQRDGCGQGCGGVPVLQPPGRHRSLHSPVCSDAAAGRRELRGSPESAGGVCVHGAGASLGLVRNSVRLGYGWPVISWSRAAWAKGDRLA